MKTSSPLALWLALHHLPGLGAIRIQQLYQRFGSARAIFEAPRDLLQALGLGLPMLRALDDFIDEAPGNTLEQAVLRSLDWAARDDCYLLCPEDPVYPALLQWIPDPPPVLYVQGLLDVLQQPQIALVGSRHPSASGLDNARTFADSLGRAGLTITSGLALGVDGAAHEATLRAGAATVAVLGSGIDAPYPASHRGLAAAIIGQGALVSEFALGTPPRAGNFPRRNRIISGLSLGTLVIEASLRSGSLITARLALEQGREVYALPGSIHNPQARGCHHLIKQGAKLVETVADILEELPALLALCQSDCAPATMSRPAPQAKPETSPDLFSSTEGLFSSTDGAEPAGDPPPPDSPAARILEALGYDRTALDTLVARTGLSAQVVSAELMSLELAGWVVRTPGGYQRR